MTVEHDLIVVGAGPAGLAAGITARALHMRALILDTGPEPGGQLLANPTPILDLPGIEANTGPELALKLRQHLERLGGEVRRATVQRIDAAAGVVETAGERLSASTLLLASGAGRRRLGVPGERDEPGRGLSPAARRFGSRFAGRPVVVVGGSDVALEEAALFARLCPRVVLVHRGASLRGRPDFRRAVADEPRIEVLLETRLTAILGDAEVEAAVVVGPAGERRVEAAAVVISVGLAPRSELVSGQIELDAAGFVRVDLHQRTSVGRLYAAGDVCEGSSWMVASAMGQAATAVKDIERRMVSGEFPMGPAPGSPFAPANVPR